MNQTDPAPKPARSAWRSIGEILLPVDTGGGDMVHSSLQERLAVLQLPMDFIHRTEMSIGEILERAATKGTGLAYVHLFLYVPANYSLAMGSWGFFRIERIEAEGPHDSHNHAVDLYLYPE